MPTVLQIDGYSFVIFTQDHLPPHVHVFARGCEAIVILGCPKGPPETRENYRFKMREMRRILEIAAEHMELLCSAWKEIHDHQG